MKDSKFKKLLKGIALTAACAVTLSAFSACGSKESELSSKIDTSTLDESKSFTITLYEDKAPITCKNFEKLVDDGFYDGLTFHRVVEGFMAQGGDPKGDGTGGSDETIKGEFSANGVENDLSHKRGIVSMARSQDYDSASSQFFICYSDDCTFLDGQYAAFGEVTEGMDVVDEFLNVERTTGSDGAESSPKTPITIKKAVMIDDDDSGNHRAKFYMDFTYDEPEPRTPVDASFVISLYADKAPITCENFEKLVKEGFYDGLTFHRVVDGFMAQGGDPNGDGTGGSDETIKGEFSENGVENDLSHKRGIVSMARSQDYDSASSQFFICYTDDCTFLDGKYAAFGEVTEGMDVVDGFLEVERTTGSDGAKSSPKTPITITKAEMIEDDADGNHRVKFTVNY